MVGQPAPRVMRLNNWAKEHLSQNLNLTSKRVGCCPILLKLNITPIVKFIHLSLRNSLASYKINQNRGQCNFISLDKVQTPNAKFCYSTPGGHTRTMQWAFRKIVFDPTSEVFFIYTTTPVKMLIVTEHKTTTRGMFCWIFKHNALWVSKSLTLSSCANILLYRSICISL